MVRKAPSKTSRSSLYKTGARYLAKRVQKKAGTIKASSRRWLERQLNDPYVQRAKEDGYRSRAAYKLLEIEQRYKIFKKGAKIIDLGSAPGGWSQVAVRLSQQQAQKNKKESLASIVAIDYLAMEPIEHVHFLQMDFLDERAPAAILQLLQDKPDLVLSDMAAPTTGHRKTDHWRTMELCQKAAFFAVDVLKPGGSFLAKTFQGGTEGELLQFLKQNFRKVSHVKPPSSRAESVELYLLAQDLKSQAIDR